MFQTQPDIQVYQDKNYKVLKDEENSYYLADRVSNIGIITIKSILADQAKSFDLAANNVTSSILIRSVYAFSGSTSNDEIWFYIYQKDEAGVSTRIAQQRYYNNEMPYSFPFGAVLTPNMVIEVKPKYNVDNLFIYFQPVNVIARFSV